MSYTRSVVRSVVIALIVLVGYVSSFVVIPPISGAARRIPQARTIESLDVRSSSSPKSLWHVLQAQSMDGENLRPDAAEALEEMAKEANGKIEKLVTENKVMLFMKGNRIFPQCGFSNNAIQVLRACEVEFETFDVLEDSAVREAVKQYSSWPTIPQLYIDGEFTGGADIMVESFQSGELKKTLEEKGCKFISA